jgi:hypothetical protein
MLYTARVGNAVRARVMENAPAGMAKSKPEFRSG